MYPKRSDRDATIFRRHANASERAKVRDWLRRARDDEDHPIDTDPPPRPKIRDGRRLPNNRRSDSWKR